MLYAATGLRRDEILSLKPEDIDFDKRMITPGNHRSARFFGNILSLEIPFKCPFKVDQSYKNTG
jgi:integrase